MIGTLFKKTLPKYISFEDLQNITKYNSTKYIIINTLLANEQDCLITNTITSNSEETVINNLISQYEYYDKTIIIYGKNCNDINAETKYTQIKSLGFKHVYIYKGGIFEWLLLQDIYGKELFPTTINILDILRYKPNNIL
tara:strand:+ start:1693 stop:2112 length:420 start_codon:yes stop_codon:yes gene_type:complete